MQVVYVYNSQSKLVIILQKDCLQTDIALATQRSIGRKLFLKKIGGCNKKRIQGTCGLDRFDLRKKLIN
jgi:hypothetical protein